MNRNYPNSVDDILTTLRVLGIELETKSFSSMLEKFPVVFWIHNENNNIVYGNREFRDNFSTCDEQKCHQCLMGSQKVCNCCLSCKALSSNGKERCKLCKRGNCVYDINIFHIPITNRNGQKYILKSSFHIKDQGILAENLHQNKPDTERKAKESF